MTSFWLFSITVLFGIWVAGSFEEFLAWVWKVFLFVGQLILGLLIIFGGAYFITLNLGVFLVLLGLACFAVLVAWIDKRVVYLKKDH